MLTDRKRGIPLWSFMSGKVTPATVAAQAQSGRRDQSFTIHHVALSGSPGLVCDPCRGRGVVGAGPGVSLRSTPGYRRTSLRDGRGGDDGAGRVGEPGGFGACSRWLRSAATTPPGKVERAQRSLSLWLERPRQPPVGLPAVSGIDLVQGRNADLLPMFLQHCHQD